MFLSMISEDDIKNLTPTEKERIVFGGLECKKEKADIGIVLGGPREVLLPRAKAAYKAYNEGRIGKIVVSGSPLCETSEYGVKSEALQLQNYLIDLGVRKEDIVLETNALTTVENMIFSTLVIQRTFDFENVKSIMIITTMSHLKRSLLYAKAYLPGFVRICGDATSENEEIPGMWMDSPFYSDRMIQESIFLRRMIILGQIDDIEF